MANCTIILGKSGTGKSSSIRKMNPEETFIFNVLKKKLPFKGSSSLYNEENKNMVFLDNYVSVIEMLENISDKAAHIKNIIIDDFIYIMRKEYFKRAKEKGYDKYTDLAAHFQQIISTCESLRDNLNIFFILHSEDITSDNSITGYKVATIGKLLDTQYNPIEVVPMVLYSAIKYDNNGEPSYGFYTKATKEGSIEIPAKSPDGMFEEIFIPNDLDYVVKKINEYYN